MVQVDVEYNGDLHCTLTHGPSGSKIQTDAPKDNQGKGEYFSPTDLVGAALASCVLTVMGIVAQRKKIDISGAKARVTKEMASGPVRRIGKLTVLVTLPKNLNLQESHLLETTAKSCPVHKSLHPDVELDLQFHYE